MQAERPAAQPGVWLARLPGLGLLVVLLVFLLARLARYLDFAWASVRYPFQLEYGEGLVWQQAALMLGPDAYRPIDHYPYTAFEYPPLFHLAVRGLMYLGLDPLLSGRLISVLSTGATCILVSMLAWRFLRDRVGWRVAAIGAVVAALLPLTFQPVLQYSRLMRVDMLAIALGFLGVNLVVASLRRAWLGYAAIIVFVMAGYTKQTAIAAPTACLLALAIRNWKAAARILLVGSVIAAVVALYLHRVTEGEFFRHILTYNMNTWRLSTFLGMVLGQTDHALYFLLAWGGLVAAWLFSADRMRLHGIAAFRAGIRKDTGLFVLVVVTAMFLISIAMSSGLGKTGADINYLIEGMCVWTILLGIAVGLAVARLLSAPPGRWSIMTFALFGLLLFQGLNLPLFSRTISGVILIDRQQIANLWALTARIRTAGAPVLSDDVVLLLRAGQRMPWETALFTELTRQGIWDEADAVAMVRERKFAFVVIATPRSDAVYDERFSPAIQTAIAASYPVVTDFAGRTIHSPR